MPIYRITAPKLDARQPDRRKRDRAGFDGLPAVEAVDLTVQAGRHRIHYLADQLTAGGRRKVTVTQAGRRRALAQARSNKADEGRLRALFAQLLNF